MKSKKLLKSEIIDKLHECDYSKEELSRILNYISRLTTKSIPNTKM